MTRWLRDPLLHFVVAAVAIHLWLSRSGEIGARTIEVRRTDLHGVLQHRAGLYDAPRVAAAFEALPADRRQQLLQDFVRQEVLYREALARGLDKSDPVIRQRLVQQMELLLREEAVAAAAVSDEQVRTYFEAHRDAYGTPATVSFGHVFFDTQRHGAATRAKAEAELADLRRHDLRVEDALERGDRFPYQRNYADTVPAALVPELGEAVAEALDAAPLGQWHGPVSSPLGWHLLRVTRRSAATLPSLDSLREAVAADALQAAQVARGEASVQALVARYKVVPAADLGQHRRGPP